MNKNYLLQHPIHTDQNTELPQSRDHHDRTTMTVTTMTVTTHRSVTATTHRSPRLHTVRPTHRSPRPPTTAPIPVRDHHDCELTRTFVGPSTWTFLIRAIGPAKKHRKDDPNNETTHECPSISARPKSTNAPFGIPNYLLV